MTLSDAEIRAINTLRRSPHAATIMAVAKRAAAKARERYELTPSTEENRMAAVESNDVVAVLFTQEL